MNQARARNHLTPPPPAVQLAAFPDHDYRSVPEVFRSHSHRHGPWWFSGSGEGRFDLDPPHGTCYVAEREIVAVLETFGGVRVIPDYLVAQRALSCLRLPDEVRVADLTCNAAIRFGVTAEIFTTIDYPLTQRWAAALHQAGFDGIRYWARHDLQHTAACLALFGPMGAAGLHVVGTERLTDRPDLLSTLENETGITVLPTPPI